MHPAKRRRLDQSTATLTKPFRSPLRVDVKTAPQADAPELQKSSTLPPASSQRSARSSPGSQRQQSPASRSPLTSSAARSSAKDPDYIVLQKQHSSLSLQLTLLRQSLDTAQQALEIESSDQDLELEALIQKWRAVARDAAEELFADAKERVSKMGGIGAWREQTQEQSDRWPDEEPAVPLTDEQREQVEIQKEETMAEALKYGLVEANSAAAVEQEDDSFTMDMMLKQLHIELDVVGFDKQLQQWSD